MSQTTYYVRYPTGDVFPVDSTAEAKEWSEVGYAVKVVTEA